MQPFEIVSAPLTVWLAPVGTAFPTIDTQPAAEWFKLGTNGDKNYDDDGVTVSHEQSINTWRGAGSVGPVKAWRNEEELSIGFTLVDISPAQYAKVLNDATVTETAAATGTPGTAEFGLSQGAEIATFALLARGKSPVDENMSAQYQVKRCYQAENPEPVYTKGGDSPAGLEIGFAALEDLTDGVAERERFGKLVIGTAPAA